MQAGILEAALCHAWAASNLIMSADGSTGAESRACPICLLQAGGDGWRTGCCGTWMCMACTRSLHTSSSGSCCCPACRACLRTGEMELLHQASRQVSDDDGVFCVSPCPERCNYSNCGCVKKKQLPLTQFLRVSRNALFLH